MRGVDFEETGSSLSCLGPWTIDKEFGDDDEEEGKEAVGCVRSHSYYRLPRHLLRLSILKLDGSVFDVHVGRNATVAALKQAIEDVFSSSPKDGLGKISWSHVWGHFCLSFNGEKLLNDRAYLRSFRINDGDQLCFIHHLSTNYSPTKRQPEDQVVSCSRQHQMVPPYSDNCNKAEAEDSADDEDNWDYFKHNNYEDHEITMPEFKLAHFLGGWLSYFRLWGVKRKGSEAPRRASRFAVHCLGGGSGMIRL